MKRKNSIGTEFALYYSPNPEIREKLGGRPYFNSLGNDLLNPLIDYFVMLDCCYVFCIESNNIDNWIGIIDEQIHLKNNKEYIGDNVCVFFENDVAKIIGYMDYENGNDNYYILETTALKKLTMEWKFFVMEWEVKKLKGEII